MKNIQYITVQFILKIYRLLISIYVTMKQIKDENIVSNNLLLAKRNITLAQKNALLPCRNKP